MEIILSKKYTLKSDDKQFILVETKGKQKNQFYFSTLSGVPAFLIKKRIRTTKNIDSLAKLEEKIDTYAKEIEEKFSDYIKKGK